MVRKSQWNGKASSRFRSIADLRWPRADEHNAGMILHFDFRRGACQSRAQNSYRLQGGDIWTAFVGINPLAAFYADA